MAKFSTKIQTNIPLDINVTLYKSQVRFWYKFSINWVQSLRPLRFFVPTEILAHTSSAQFVPTVLMLNAIRTPRATSLAPLLVYDSTNELWVPFGFCHGPLTCALRLPSVSFVSSNLHLAWDAGSVGICNENENSWPGEKGEYMNVQLWDIWDLWGMEWGALTNCLACEHCSPTAAAAAAIYEVQL